MVSGTHLISLDPEFSPVFLSMPMYSVHKISIVQLVQILSVTVRVIQKDAEEKKTSFNPRPYFRLFIDWLNDLTTTDVHHDGPNFQVHILQTL
jgi:hypothetical protein